MDDAADNEAAGPGQGCSGPLRADAIRNRAALVAAAAEVFRERGLEAPLDEIARRAGLGNATLYRRFPSRQGLIDAVFAERMAVYARAAEDGLADPDPWAGFCGYVRHLLQLQAQDRGLADLLVTVSPEQSPEIEELRTRAYTGLVKLVARAKRAGALRKDFRTQDLVLILMANAGLVHRTARTCPQASQRLAGLLLDGLQAQAATAGPSSPDESLVIAAMATPYAPAEG
jgi:AcrR family transcriptional regulator